MAWEKASQELLAQLAEALAGYDCAMRKMFGSEAYFVSGNMFASVLGARIMLRMGQGDRTALFEQYGDGLSVAPMGRRMREYVGVPDEVSADEDALADWIARSYAYAASLPPKTAG